MYSSVRRELDFHPQLWLTLNTSGALVNRDSDDPVALAQVMVKYAHIDARGSRKGCCGTGGGEVAGRFVAETGSVGEPAIGELGVAALLEVALRGSGYIDGEREMEFEEGNGEAGIIPVQQIS